MFLDRIKYPFAFIKALKMDEQKKYSQTIKILKKYNNFIKKNRDKFPDYYILLAESYARLGKYTDAEINFGIAIDTLNETSLLNEDEKEYLKKYIYKWLKYLASIYKNTLAVENYKKKINTQHYNNKNIRNSFKINFSQEIFLKV